MTKDQPKPPLRERVSRVVDKLLDPEGVRQQELERDLAKWQAGNK
jgi:hypothetical protein